jgi:YidC/Oxa1 family membrane protein insertase
VFAGAKEVPIIEGYQDQFNILNFDLMIDWGWFYFITKPMFWLIDWLFKLFGNFGVAILAPPCRQADLLPAGQQVLRLDGQDEEGAAEARRAKAKHGDDKMALQQA